MFGYVFVDTGMVETIHGVAWSGEIRYKGRLVAQVSNNGQGGCNDYVWANDTDEAWFRSYSRAYAKDAFEPEDAFVDRLWSESLSLDESSMLVPFSEEF